MESINIYFNYVNDEIVSVHTERVDSKFEGVTVVNEDEFISLMRARGLKINEDISENLREIFDNVNALESINDESNDDKKFIIKHWVSNRSFGELIDMFENEEIKVPDMQRPFVWDSFRSSRLIESIVMGLQIPPLFLLEVDNNVYEIIDGYQRLTTLYNFVKGNPWVGKKGKRNITSKLSKNLVIPSIRGKSFSELSDDQKRIIKRSTIPLIEFKQLNPDNYTSKYLIFERINTGSEKLSSMQIRKSLAYGSFINQLYREANQKEFITLFSNSQIKKDLHTEAFLRIIAISDIVYNRFKPTQSGLENILNEYCEEKKQETIDSSRINFVFDTIGELKEIFIKENMFRRVNHNGDYEGLMNISILESIIGVIVEAKMNKQDYKIDEEAYKVNMKQVYERSISGEQNNPFSFSTGAIESMKSRFNICETIIGSVLSE